jgi:hypothetical protein
VDQVRVVRTGLARTVATVTTVAALAGVSVLAGATQALALQTPQSQVVSADPADFTPDVLDGKVESIAQVGNHVIIGGTFTQLQPAGGGTVVNQSFLASFDATTGAIDPSFDPVLNGEVTAVIPAGDGSSVFVGGQFSTVDGAAASHVTRIAVATGARVPGFTVPAINQDVYDLRLVRNQLVVAGAFNKVGATTRTTLASFDPDTGVLTNFVHNAFGAPRTGARLLVLKIDATADGRRIMAVGNFGTVDGQTRDQVVLLDSSGGSTAVLAWSTAFFAANCASEFATYLRDLDIAPDGSS